MTSVIMNKKGRVKMARNQWNVRKESKLVDFLIQYSGINKKDIHLALSSGCVIVNDQIEKRPHILLKAGDQIKILAREKKPDLPFDILYEDENLLAINKPSGLLSISAGMEKEKTAYHLARNYLRQKDDQAMIFVVHRLDRDTSGVLLFAKDEKTKKQLQENWNSIVKERGYMALVDGLMEKDQGTLKHYLSESKTQQVYISNAKSGKLAITHYRVLKRYKAHTLVEIFLDTGRKNQIRVQMAGISHPLVGDSKYNNQKRYRCRLCLHAHRLSLVDPRNQKLLTLEATAPDFYAYIVGK